MSDTARRIDPGLLAEVRRYGAFDIAACFNCGNCTSVCPLSDEHGSFPRKMIRSGQVGIRENLLSGSEPWLCYYCGECSETCPREAEPGEYMAALRRYEIVETDPTGIAKLFYRNPLVLSLLTVAIGVLLALFLVQSHGHSKTGWLFANLVAYETIHVTGAIIGALGAFLFVVSTLRFMSRHLKGHGGFGFILKRKPAELIAAARAVGQEILTMKRHGDCKTKAQTANPWYMTPRFIHGFILWGFLGLATATGLDFLIMYLLGTDIFLPGRIVGTVSGLALVYGVGVAIAKRVSGKQKHSKHSHPADVWLLLFLFVLGITGFWLEAVVMFGRAGVVHDWVLLIHAVFAMELVLLIAVTKLSHAVYRPISLFIHGLTQKGV